MATRQLYWNIEGHWLLYPMFLIALGFFIYGFYRRYRLWRLGQPENRWPGLGKGIKDLIIYGLGQKRIFKEGYPGIMHAMIFWGFLVLVFATTIVALQADFGLNIFQGSLYLFIKVTANAFGLLAMVGILMAAWRRYVIRPKHLENRKDDALLLILIFLILLTGFVVQGLRMAIIPDPWGAYAFVGYWIAPLLKGMFSEQTLLDLHRYSWWAHPILAMVFIGYFPYSKLSHIFLAPVNQFLRQRGPVGIPEKIDFEDESLETFGKSQLREFSWKTLFNSDACLRCGRCQNHCPAYLSGKHLNPKQTIQDMRVAMEETGSALQALAKTSQRQAAEQGLTDGDREAAAASEFGLPSLIGEVIAEEDL
jgi:nitrate reductase gamma subunit/ferredoxin